MNNVGIIGRVARPVEMKRTTTGKDVARFTVAVPRKKNKEEEKAANFIKVATFNNYARSCYQYLRPGDLVAVQGYLRQDTFTDRDTGKHMSYVEVVANSVDFLNTKREKNLNAEPEGNGVMSYDEDSTTLDGESIPDDEFVED